jgi:hypothetical protein
MRVVCEADAEAPRLEFVHDHRDPSLTIEEVEHLSDL